MSFAIANRWLTSTHRTSYRRVYLALSSDPVDCVSPKGLPVKVATLHTTAQCSAGHNKWSKIKHSKAANDQLQNTLIVKMTSAIAVAAKAAGPDPNNNIRLATAIEAAKRANIPKKNIESAINRGAGIGAETSKPLENVVYEGVGPGGVSFVVEALTDNKARTIAKIRHEFTRFNGTLTPTLFLFNRKGRVFISKKKDTTEPVEFDSIFENAIEASAEDLFESERATGTGLVSGYDIIMEPANTARLAQTMKEHGYVIEEMEIEYLANPDTAVCLDDIVSSDAVSKLVDSLQEVEDVTGVYTNVK
ncbi:transcriptional regulator TACO1-like protein [Dipodascopsis tothii]|uniref:transcriptional regulator TACO1-like protein n=1 Tax=Dipodascopsis tothii TaxID=44089 RepID=UPI0034CDCED4